MIDYTIHTTVCSSGNPLHIRHRSSISHANQQPKHQLFKAFWRQLLHSLQDLILQLLLNLSHATFDLLFWRQFVFDPVCCMGRDISASSCCTKKIVELIERSAV
ncbi:MAG: hypothetical protein WAM11_05230 [Cyanobium sp.]